MTTFTESEVSDLMLIAWHTCVDSKHPESEHKYDPRRTDMDHVDSILAGAVARAEKGGKKPVCSSCGSDKVNYSGSGPVCWRDGEWIAVRHAPREDVICGECQITAAPEWKRESGG
ncbi:MAG: hypothetical protein ACYYKD_05365 [Rhodospirillales bacterium]